MSYPVKCIPDYLTPSGGGYSLFNRSGMVFTGQLLYAYTRKGKPGVRFYLELNDPAHPEYDLTGGVFYLEGPTPAVGSVVEARTIGALFRNRGVDHWLSDPHSFMPGQTYTHGNHTIDTLTAPELVKLSSMVFRTYQDYDGDVY